jgi:hypothetical protein
VDEGGQRRAASAARLGGRDHPPELAHDRLGRAGARLDELELLLEPGAGDRDPRLAVRLASSSARSARSSSSSAVSGSLHGRRRSSTPRAPRRGHAVGDGAAARAVGARQQDDELVAAVAGDDVVVAQLAAQGVGHDPQLLVAGLVARSSLTVLKSSRSSSRQASGAPVRRRGRSPRDAQLQGAVVDERR